MMLHTIIHGIIKKVFPHSGKGGILYGFAQFDETVL